MGFIARLVVGRIEIIDTASQASIHNGEVLIRQCKIDNQRRLIVIEECLELFYVVGIHLCCLDSRLSDGPHDCIALLFTPRRNHKIGKNISILCYFKCCNSSDATGADHQNPI